QNNLAMASAGGAVRDLDEAVATRSAHHDATVGAAAHRIRCTGVLYPPIAVSLEARLRLRPHARAGDFQRSDLPDVYRPRHRVDRACDRATQSPAYRRRDSVSPRLASDSRPDSL